MNNNGVQLIQFYIDPVEVRTAEGQPNYEDREWIRITNPGGKDVIERVVKDSDTITYMAQYAAFKKGEVFEGEGFKLRDVSFLSKSELENCKRAQIFTVEQLAGINDIGMKALGMNGRTLSQKAKDWLDGKKNIDVIVNKVNALEQTLASQQDQLGALNAVKAESAKKDVTISDLRNQLDELLTKKKK